MAKDYVRELERNISLLESGKITSLVFADEVVNKIVWCWNWRKITDNQKNEFCDRMIKFFDK